MPVDPSAPARGSAKREGQDHAPAMYVKPSSPSPRRANMWVMQPRLAVGPAAWIDWVDFRAQKLSFSPLWPRLLLGVGGRIPSSPHVDGAELAEVGESVPVELVPRDSATELVLPVVELRGTRPMGDVFCSPGFERDDRVPNGGKDMLGGVGILFGSKRPKA